MSLSHLFRRGITAVAAFAVLGAGTLAAATPAQAAVTHRLPVPVQVAGKWQCSTRANHSPQRSVDLTNIGGKTNGERVAATAAGTVIVSKDLTTSYGRYIVIKHADGTQTLYAHLSKRLVGVGATVKYGDVIGYIGSTGNSTGPHLHYEQRTSAGTAVSIKFYGKPIAYYSSTQRCPMP